MFGEFVLGHGGGSVRFPLASQHVRRFGESGAPGGIRTHDPRIRNPVLYPAELRAPGRAIAAAMSVRQARRCALWPGQWAAAVLLAMGVVDVATAQELRLADGRSAVLAGILALDPPAPGIRVSLVDPQTLSLDRHGRLRGQLRGPDGIWLQAAMIESGLAVVDPATDVAPDTLVELLRQERVARASRRGR